jgi:hypothetical protein
VAGSGGGSSWQCGTITTGALCNCHDGFHNSPTDNCNTTTYGADTLCCYDPGTKLCQCSAVSCRQGSLCTCAGGLTDSDGAVVASCSGTHICKKAGLGCWGLDFSCTDADEVTSCDVSVAKECPAGSQLVSDCASAPPTN